MIKRYFKRFPHALQGITYAARNDFGFGSQLIGVTLVIAIAGFLFRPLSDSELLFMILAWILILMTELQNSALETALDKLHPEIHDHIKHSKDMASSSVLLAGVFLLIVLVVIGLSRLV